MLADELRQGSDDVLLGYVEGQPCFIDAEPYGRWNEPEVLLDATDGAPEGFSLCTRNAHFLILSRSGEARQLRAAYSAQRDCGLSRMRCRWRRWTLCPWERTLRRAKSAAVGGIYGG